MFIGHSLIAATISQFNVTVPMRDGVRLSANLFHPSGGGRYPTILLRTPYNKGSAITSGYQAYVDHGYAVMVQDVRGRYKSAGVFEPLNQEINDGDDTLNWIAAQPWSNGAVGMYGGSYLGIAQWKAALTHNPHLRAIFPYVSGDDDYRDRFYSPGGAMKLGHRLLWLSENMRARNFTPDFSKYIWALPVQIAGVAATGHSLPIWTNATEHPTYDSFWKKTSVREHLKDINLPVFSVAGWYDNYVESDLDAFTLLRKHDPAARIMVGPWAHVFSDKFKGVDFGPNSQVSLGSIRMKWFDEWLKGAPPAESAHPVRIFVMGINRWRDEDEWPLIRAKEEKLYLNADGQLGSKPGRDSEPDHFVYDPRNPAPTVGGAVCCTPEIFPWGPKDQRRVETRKDVLVYSTEPLPGAVEVTGPIRVVLYAASSAVDTDFTAKLVDVFPDGTARNLTDGILRTRYRESLENPVLMKADEAYRMTIDAGVTSNVFAAGHRIRVEISSSNFPRFDRNPNTGRAVADDREMRKAAQTIYHDHDRHSYMELPVVPAERQPVQLTSAKPTRYVAKRPSSTQATQNVEMAR